MIGEFKWGWGGSSSVFLPVFLKSALRVLSCFSFCGLFLSVFALNWVASVFAFSASVTAKVCFLGSLRGGGCCTLQLFYV